MPPTESAQKVTPASFAAAVQAVDQALGAGGEPRMKARFADGLEGGQAGGDRDRIAGQRAGLIDRADRSELVHDLGAAAEGADRHAAADHLAERGEVGADAEQLLRAAEVDAEAGHHFVENQQRAGGIAQPAHRAT